MRALWREILCRMVGDIGLSCAIQQHKVDFLIAIPVAGEGNMLVIGRKEPGVIQPGRLIVCRQVVAQIADFGPVSAHDVNLLIAIPVAGEANPLPVRRPGWVQIIRRVHGQVDLTGTIGIHNVNLVVAVSI